MAHSERMELGGRHWLRMDRPANLMIIVGVLPLAGPVDVKRLEATLAERILAYGRFRKRVETRADSHYWFDDPNFDIAHHIKRTRLPGGAGKAELRRFVAELAGRPARPRPSALGIPYRRGLRGRRRGRGAEFIMPSGTASRWSRSCCR